MIVPLFFNISLTLTANYEGRVKLLKMESTLSQNLKAKSKISKNKKEKTKRECPCIRRLILSILKKKKIGTEVLTTSDADTNKTSSAENKTESETSLKTKKKSRIIRLPKKGCIIPFLITLFNDLSSKSAVRMDANDTAKAVDVISKVKMALDSGKAWKGKVKIAENLHLKLYKTGLVLHHKQ